jgi:predicted membrane protein
MVMLVKYSIGKKLQEKVVRITMQCLSVILVRLALFFLGNAEEFMVDNDGRIIWPEKRGNQD